MNETINLMIVAAIPTLLFVVGFVVSSCIATLIIAFHNKRNREKDQREVS